MESKAHYSLVHMIYKFMLNLPEVEKCMIEVDSFDVEGKVTRMIDGFVPDLYYNYNNLCIIGEAKTEKDLDRAHSINQYKSYISHLKKQSSNGSKSIIIISVPWTASISAYKILKKIIAEDEYIKLIIINELGVYKEYEKNNFK